MTTLIKPLKGKKKKDCNSGDNSHGLINDQLDVGIYDSKVCGVVSWSSRQVCTGAFNTMGNTAGGGTTQISRAGYQDQFIHTVKQADVLCTRLGPHKYSRAGETRQST